MKKYLPVAFVFLAAAIGAGLYARFHPINPPPAAAPLSAPTAAPAPVLMLNASLTNGNLTISVNPATPPASLIAFTLRATIRTPEPSISSPATAPTISPEFQTSGWSYPFKTITAMSPTEQELKAAGFFASTKKFDINRETALLTFPLPLRPGQTVTVTINGRDTTFYGRSDTPYRVDGVDREQTLHGE